MTDKSHKQKLEELAYENTKSKSNLNDNFYNENENMDTFNVDSHKDAQYLDLLQKMGTSTQQKKDAKDLSELPKYKGKKVTAADLMKGNFDDSFDEEEEEFEDEDIQQDSDDQEEVDQDIEESEEDSDEKPQNVIVSDQRSDSEEDDLDIEEDDDEQDDLEEEEDDLESDGYSQSIEEEEDEENSNSDDAKDLYRQAMMGTNKKKVNNNKIDDIINEMEQEDKKIIPKKKEEMDNEVTKGKHTRNQILFWKQQAVDRMSLQKALDISKKLPLEMDFYQSQNPQKKYLELLLLQNLNLMIKNRNLFYNKISEPQENNISDNDSTTAETEYEYLEDYIFQQNNLDNETEYYNNNLNIKSIQDQFEASQTKTQKYIEDNILKWSQKTNLVSQNLKKQGFSQLLQTPIGQAQKALKQIERLVIKSQLKRSKFRILGKSEKNLYQETDKNIYDDADYYHELMKEQIEEEGGQIADEDGLNINNTKIYLLERKLKQQEKLANELANGKKQVDRRASKARKIRYNTHQKLVNFTNPVENIYLLEGRDEIIRSLFGEEVKLYKKQIQQQSKQQDLQSEEPKLNKKRKLNNNKQQQEQEFGQDDENFALI